MTTQSPILRRLTRLSMLGSLALAVALLTTLFANLGSVPVAHAQTTWTLAWSDEFSGAAGTGVDTNNWLYDTGTGYGCSGCPSNWGTGEVETDTTSTANVYQDGAGHLVIKAIKAKNQSWTSGRIETQQTDFQPSATGLMAVEASIQLPNLTGKAAGGYWPAFWMLGAPFRGNYLNWPSIGEIDAMENVNGLDEDWGTFHCGTYPGGPCNEPNGIGGTTSGASPSLQSSFHTYRVELDRRTSPQQIRYYLDGVNFFTVYSNQVDATTWDNATNHGFFIILDLAIGGQMPKNYGWGGQLTGTASGGELVVDYVRVYYGS